MNELEGLELYQLMDLIKPVTEPTAISYMPQTSGWLYLLAFFITSTGLILWRKRLRHLKRQHRLAAISLLTQQQHSALKISEILKRAALYDFPRQDIASLTGEPWAQFLNQHVAHPEQFKSFYLYAEHELPALNKLAIAWLNDYEVTK